MKKTMLVFVLAALATLAFPPSPVGADVDTPKADILFGVLLKGASCPAATHTLVSPCFPYAPKAFVVFPQGKNVTRYEGHNVTMRGTVDQTSCPLPLIRATRVALTDLLPPCPPPQCNPGDPPPCPPQP